MFHLVRRSAVPVYGSTRSAYGRTRIGNRDWVGHGHNGMAVYKDDAHFPFPAIRFKENDPFIKCLRDRETCDWRMLSCEEKKALYRASFCQTFSEFQSSTGAWKWLIGSLFFTTSFGFWFMTFYHHCVQEPLPITLSDEWQAQYLRYMLEYRVNPIDGLSSKWDYENDCWK